MIWSEFRVEITALAMDGAGALRIRGSVGAWTKDHRLSGVQIAYVRGDSMASVVYSGPKGEFDIATEPGDAAKLVLSHTFFRSLELDLVQLARAARPAS
ncbi:MAG TPA: hypothetical protein VGX50_08295 [Longimicrobium sp.]|jgi:hypothetical protein|nr:hypothetical protein [Longimicrobium sp.]